MSTCLLLFHPDVAKALQCGDPPPSGLSADETRAYGQLKVLFARRRAYASMMGTRPQTLYGLADSPVGLAAWLLDHGDGYGQPAAGITSAVLGRMINGHPAGDLTRDDILDDITLYWLTNTAISSARSPSGPAISNLALILLNNDAHSEGPKMRKLLVGLLITGSLCLTFTPRTAVAGNGEVAAGIFGGLAVGALFGAAVASGPRYYQPAPVYVAPAPVYVAPECYWTRGAPVWDGYRGIWYRPRIQVCD